MEHDQFNDSVFTGAVPQWASLFVPLVLDQRRPGLDGRDHERPLVSEVNEAAALAKQWSMLGFSPSQAKQWLEVHGFLISPATAAAFRDVKISPAESALRLSENGTENPQLPSLASLLVSGESSIIQIKTRLRRYHGNMS